eukprot:2032067-Prymnesium_polylepis.2
MHEVLRDETLASPTSKAPPSSKAKPTAAAAPAPATPAAGAAGMPNLLFTGGRPRVLTEP